MVRHMLQETFLADCSEWTLCAAKQSLHAWVLATQVILVRVTLDCWVITVRTAVWSLSSVPHGVPSQWIVVTSSVFTQGTTIRLLTCMLAKMHLQHGFTSWCMPTHLSDSIHTYIYFFSFYANNMKSSWVGDVGLTISAVNLLTPCSRAKFYLSFYSHHCHHLLLQGLNHFHFHWRWDCFVRINPNNWLLFNIILFLKICVIMTGRQLPSTDRYTSDSCYTLHLPVFLHIRSLISESYHGRSCCVDPMNCMQFHWLSHHFDSGAYI